MRALDPVLLLYARITITVGGNKLCITLAPRIHADVYQRTIKVVHNSCNMCTSVPDVYPCPEGRGYTYQAEHFITITCNICK